MSPINPIPTNEQELATLRRFIDDLHPDGALVQFFTTDLYEWLITQLRNDFTPDLYADHQRLTRSLTNAVNDADTLSKVLTTEQNTRIHLEGEYAELNEDLRALREREDALLAENVLLSKVNTELQEEQTRLLHELNLRARQDDNQQLAISAHYADKLAERDAEIVRLKAKLYDLMTERDDLLAGQVSIMSAGVSLLKTEQEIKDEQDAEAQRHIDSIRRSAANDDAERGRMRSSDDDRRSSRSPRRD